MPSYDTDPGPFLSLLDWIEGLGEIPLNVARGHLGGAGRKLVDSVTAIPDSALPGDWLPQVSRPEDDVTASQVFHIDRATNPGVAKAVDLVGGTAINPATWLGLRGNAVKAGIPFTEGVEIPGSRAALQKAKAGLGVAYGHLPEPIKRIASTSAQGVRRAANWLDIPDEEEAFLRQAKASGNQAARVASAEVENIYRGLTRSEREAVGEIAHQVDRKGTTDRTQWSVLEDPDQYLRGKADIRQDVVREAVAKRQALMDVLADESPDAGVMNIAKDVRNKSYIHRQFGGAYFDEDTPLAFSRVGGGDAMKKRASEIQRPADLVDFLKKQDVDLEFDALSADANRAAQQARLVERGAIGKQLASKAGIEGQFLLSNPEHRTKVGNVIAELEKQPGMADYAYKLKNAWEGIPPRSDNWFFKGLHGANKLFKGAATYGLVVPRISFDVRNRTSALWQALSHPEARKTLGGNTKRLLSDLYGAWDDGFMKLTGAQRTRGSSDLTKKLDFIEQAFRESKGSTVELRKRLASHPDGALLQEALDNGILNNFVDSEELLSRMAKTPTRQRVNDVMEWPAEIAQGLEQRMRLGTFFDLRSGKKPIAASGGEAAKTVRDTFLDYDVVGEGNRMLRDVVPFASFLTQNVKQQSKFLAEQPAIAVATAQLFGDDEGLPKYPWLDQQLTIPIGLDEIGQPQYLSGLGLPIEGMTAIPGFGADDLYRDAVGSLQPMLKSAISYAADKDPLTGRAFGQYDKVFGQPLGEAGRIYNVAKGTGLTQPLTGPISQLENLFDARKSPVESALQATTGLKFTSVDPDLAERQRLEALLKARPDVRSVETLYQTEDDPVVTEQLKQLREAKDRLREKKKAAAAL